MKITKEKRFKYRENIRAKDVSDELSVGLSTVWLWAKNGKITPIKISERVTVFSIDELNKKLKCNIKKEILINSKKNS